MSEIKDKILSMRFTPDEYEKLKGYAAGKERTISSLVRELLLKEIDDFQTQSFKTEPDNAMRKTSVLISLSEHDLAKLDNYAKEHGVSRNKGTTMVIKSFLFNKTFLRADEKRSLSNIMINLKMIGRNVNQIAKALNSGAVSGSEDLAAKYELLGEVINKTADVVQKQISQENV